jgi:hypothetical protein
MTRNKQRLELAERVALDLFALGLMIHATVLAFTGRLRISDVLGASVAIGLVERWRRR